MKIGKLFRVLVIGGASLGAGLGCGDDVTGKPAAADTAIVQRDSRPIVDTVKANDTGVLAVDRGLGADQTSPADLGVPADTADVPDAALTNGGFCPNDVACENGKVKKGFYCCWSTSC